MCCKTTESWPGGLGLAVVSLFLSIHFILDIRMWSNHNIAVADPYNVSHCRVAVRIFAQCMLVQPIHCEEPTQHDKNHDYHGDVSFFPY